MKSRLGLPDLEAYASLEALCFPTPYSLKQIQDELTREDAIVTGLFQGQDLIAAILLRDVADEWWVFRILVRPDFRRIEKRPPFHRVLPEDGTPDLGS